MYSDKYEPIKQFDINLKKRDYAWSMSTLHYHNSYEIYYLTEGSRKILIQDRLYEIIPGNIILFKPNVFHRSMNHGPHTRLNIEFTSEFMDRYLTSFSKNKILSCFETEFISLTEDEDKNLKRLFAQLQTEYGQDSLFFITFVDLLRLLCNASVNQKNTMSSKQEQLLSNASKKLAPVISYINKNYTSISSLDEIAELCYINKSYLCRLFKKEMNITIMEYLNNVKIQQACEALLSSNDSFTSIAEKCGFPTASYFSYQFKKVMGCTPSEFKKNMKK